MTMARLLIVAGIICVLLLGSMPTANADAWMRWKDQTTPQYMEPVEALYDDPQQQERYVWQFGIDFSAPGHLVDDSANDFHTGDFPGRLRVVGGGTGAWREGESSIPIYVRLIVNVKNVGTEDWTDFHLRAISGCNIYGKYVMESGLWSNYWDYTSDEYGWDYVMNPMDAPLGGEYGPVYPGETFSCETWIDVTSSTGDFEVELWPTAPEPSALLVLGMGASGLAAGILRRRRAR